MLKRNLQTIFLLISILFLASCGKECLEQRNTLDTVNLEKIRPLGSYNLNDFLSKDNIQFNADSTATITYTENDTTYEFTYKLKTIGTYESNQQKF